MIHRDAVQTEVQASHSSLLSGTDNTYDLKKTLDAYEVEELDGHDLARFFPAIAPAKTTALN